jgi:hypothetical protein
MWIGDTKVTMGQVVGSCEYGNERSSSTKYKEFFAYLRIC